MSLLGVLKSVSSTLRGGGRLGFVSPKDRSFRNETVSMRYNAMIDSRGPGL